MLFPRRIKIDSQNGPSLSQLAGQLLKERMGDDKEQLAQFAEDYALNVDMLEKLMDHDYEPPYCKVQRVMIGLKLEEHYEKE